MLFELMQADLRRPTIKTLDEFFQSYLTLYYHGSNLYDEYFMEKMNKSSTRLVNLNTFLDKISKVLIYF